MQCGGKPGCIFKIYFWKPLIFSLILIFRFLLRAFLKRDISYFHILGPNRKSWNAENWMTIGRSESYLRQSCWAENYENVLTSLVFAKSCVNLYGSFTLDGYLSASCLFLIQRCGYVYLQHSLSVLQENRLLFPPYFPMLL